MMLAGERERESEGQAQEDARESLEFRVVVAAEELLTPDYICTD